MRLVTERVRLVGFDGPELRARRGSRERQAAFEAREMARELLEDTLVTCEFVGRDKWGRLLGRVQLDDGRALQEIMVQSGLCVPYDGSCARFTHRQWETFLESRNDDPPSSSSYY